MHRTLYSIKNVQVSSIFYIVVLIPTYISRKIFLENLGLDILGINTTINNLLGFLNLAELGIGSAVAFSLYKPLFEGNKKEINHIISIQGWLYRQVANFIIAGAIILMFFFPWIFSDINFPLWYIYIAFIIFLIASLLGYYVNYKQIVLAANQQNYKITICTQGTKIVKLILQIYMLIIYHNYIIWLCIELISALLITYIINRTVKSEFPWLHPIIKEGKRLRKTYPHILLKTRQIFVHKISTIVISQSSPLILYGYASLSLVSILGNYQLITQSIYSFLSGIFNSVSAGVGNLVSEGDRSKIKKVYYETLDSRFWFSSVIAFFIYKAINPFIIWWIGDKYLLDNISLLLIVLTFFLDTSRNTNDVFISAYGQFQDIWSPITEIIIFLGVSIYGGYYYGLPGILCGNLAALIFILHIWKPIFLFHWMFKEKVTNYFRHVAKVLSIILLSLVFSELLMAFSCSRLDNSFIAIAFSTIGYSFFSLLFFFLLTSGMRNFIYRFIKILKG